MHTRVKHLLSPMQEKQKSTLYLPPELHRKLKIRAAVETEPMSTIAQRAIDFYLSHPEVVEQVEGEQGHVHQVYICPDCSGSVVLRDGKLVSLRSQPGAILDDDLLDLPDSDADGVGQQLLVSC